jgi:electron transport complex protein RnfC
VNPQRHKTFSHGVHPREAKEATAHAPIRRFPFAPFLFLLLSQHTGKPSRPVVREGEEVVRGQPIAEADGFVSVPIHAPATGLIRKVGSALDADGKMAPAIIVEPYPASDQKVAWGQPVDPESLAPAEIVQAIQKMGMVGLGGAAFPAHVKFTPPEGKHVDTLIINGCECEPYLTADHRVMMEFTEKIVIGTRLVQKALGAKRAIIALESNKPDAAAAFEARLAGDAQVSVAVLATKYPQGAEKLLTKALLGLEIPSGGLPADIGVMCSNVATAAEIGTLLPLGQGLIERVITITGQGVARPGNYLIPLGTPLNFVLDHVGLLREAREVIFGGPMMGKGVAFLETPITKGVSGIVVMTEEELAPQRQIYPCIRCGHCLEACPLHLNPSRLGLLARKNEFEAMAERQHLFDCFECGCCTYVCPSSIPLVQHFRIAKAVLRKKRAAA